MNVKSSKEILGLNTRPGTGFAAGAILVSHLVGRNQRLRKANRELQRKSEHDDLTGLYTKRAFLDKANARMSKAKPNETFALFFIDLDNFKAINDNHANKHHEGDDTLKSIADMLRRTSRHGDSFNDLLAHGNRDDSDVARLGGDEFAAFLNLTGRVGGAEMSPDSRAQSFGSRLGASIKDMISGRPDLQALGFGASISYVLRQPGESAEDMLARADAEITAIKEVHHKEQGQYR